MMVPSSLDSSSFSLLHVFNMLSSESTRPAGQGDTMNTTAPEEHHEFPIFSQHSIALLPLTIIMSGLIVFTITFEVLIHILEHRLFGRHPAYLAMLNKIYKELMILGFISFTTLLLIQFIAVPHKYFSMFEFSHVWIFVIAVIFVVHGTVFMCISKRSKSHWEAMNSRPENEVIMYHECRVHITPTYRSRLLTRIASFWSWLVGSSHDREELEFHAAKHLFLRHNVLPPIFDFSYYLKTHMTNHIIGLLDVRPTTWCLLVLVLSINLLRNFIGNRKNPNLENSLEADSELVFFLIVGWVIFSLDLILLIIIRVAKDRMLHNGGVATREQQIQFIKQQYEKGLLIDKVKAASMLRAASAQVLVQSHVESGGQSDVLQDQGDHVPTAKRPSSMPPRQDSNHNTNITAPTPKGTQQFAVKPTETTKIGPDGAPVVSIELSSIRPGVGTLRKQVTLNVRPNLLRNILPCGGRSLKIFARLSEWVMLLQCFYVGLFLILNAHMAVEVYGNSGGAFYIVFSLLPALFVMVFVSPLVIKHFVFIEAVVTLQVNVFNDTIELMEEDAAIKREFTTRLHARLREQVKSTGKQPRECLLDMFMSFDQDGNCKIDPFEFALMLNDLDIHLHTSSLKRLIRLCDTDGTGAIDIRELCDLALPPRLTKPRRQNSTVHSTAPPPMATRVLSLSGNMDTQQADKEEKQFDEPPMTTVHIRKSIEGDMESSVVVREMDAVHDQYGQELGEAYIRCYLGKKITCENCKSDIVLYQMEKHMDECVTGGMLMLDHKPHVGHAPLSHGAPHLGMHAPSVMSHSSTHGLKTKHSKVKHKNGLGSKPGSGANTPHEHSKTRHSDKEHSKSVGDKHDKKEKKVKLTKAQVQDQDKDRCHAHTAPLDPAVVGKLGPAARFVSRWQAKHPKKSGHNGPSPSPCPSSPQVVVTPHPAEEVIPASTTTMTSTTQASLLGISDMHRESSGVEPARFSNDLYETPRDINQVELLPNVLPSLHVTSSLSNFQSISSSGPPSPSPPMSPEPTSSLFSIARDALYSVGSVAAAVIAPTTRTQTSSQTQIISGDDVPSKLESP